MWLNLEENNLYIRLRRWLVFVPLNFGFIAVEKLDRAGASFALKPGFEGRELFSSFL